MNRAFLKLFTIRLTLAVAMVFSLGMGMPAAAVAATPMEGMVHEDASSNSCYDQHHVTPTTIKKVSTDEQDEEDDAPAPKPLSYFIRFQDIHIEQQLIAPQDITRSPSFRPPDILRQTCNIRL